MKKIILFIITYLLLGASISSAKEYLSKDPNYINRGSLWAKTSVSNFKKKELNRHNYRIIKDPTGTSPSDIVESFSPRMGDCGSQNHGSGKKSGKEIQDGVNDCNTGRLRLEIHDGNNRIKKSTVKNKSLERWFGYYIFIPEDFPTDKLFTPYITQFYGYSKNQKGGQPPEFAASINVNREIISNGSIIVEKKDLKGKWHKIEYHIKWSTKDDGFIKIYHNGRLKSARENFVTLRHDFITVKYGTYSHRDNMSLYPSGYQFPGHTIYYSGVSISKTREKLKVNKIK